MWKEPLITYVLTDVCGVSSNILGEDREDACLEGIARDHHVRGQSVISVQIYQTD